MEKFSSFLLDSLFINESVEVSKGSAEFTNGLTNVEIIKPHTRTAL